MVRPDLVVARGPDPAELVRQALKAIGGMGQFVKSGDDVIVKPNICVAYNTYEYAAKGKFGLQDEFDRAYGQDGAKPTPASA